MLEMTGSSRIATLLLAMASASACRPSWQRLQPPDAGFAVMMPADRECLPRKWRRRTARADWVGQSCTAEHDSFLTLVTDSKIRNYKVSWIDIPAGLESEPVATVLAEFEAPELPSKSAFIREQQRACECEAKDDKAPVPPLPTTLGGRDGLARDETRPGLGNGLVSRERIGLFQGKLYMLSLSGEAGERMDRDWNLMLGSFEFIAN